MTETERLLNGVAKARAGGPQRRPSPGGEAPRRQVTTRPDTPLFQPHSNYRTPVFDKALSPRHVQRIVERRGEFSGVGKVTPHDLRRTVVTELLNRGHS